MLIDDVRMDILQRGAFDDAGTVTVSFEVDIDRKVYIKQFETEGDGEKEHVIFLGGQAAVRDLVKALKFLLKNGWEEV
jgi:hypothetical protein